MKKRKADILCYIVLLGKSTKISEKILRFNQEKIKLYISCTKKICYLYKEQRSPIDLIIICNHYFTT